ncbi:MAG: hypothetical protein ABR903_03375 [Thermodesulfovibrionales bacterium]|jgi:hypothetical protein
MFKISFMTVLLIMSGVFVWGASQAYAAQGGTNDALTYEYYSLRGSENYFVSNAAETTCAASPSGAQVNFYNNPPATASFDVTSPATSEPIGISVASHDVTLSLALGPFCVPMNISFNIYVPAIDPMEIYFLDSGFTLHGLSDEAFGQGQSNGMNTTSGQDADKGGGNGQGKPNQGFKNSVFWKSQILELSEQFTIKLPSGLYILTLSATPAGSDSENVYVWSTWVSIP